MARKISVEIVGDSANLERSFARAAGSARTFEHDVSRAGRGAVAASIGFHGLGRAVAFASGEILAGAGLVAGLKLVSEAAMHHQVIEGQLAAAVKTSGLSYARYTYQIQAAVKAQEELGFSEDVATRSFTLALRATGSVSGANRLLGVSANVARGANKDLYTSTLVLVRAYDGATTGLKRLGIQVEKGSRGFNVLGQVQRKYAGAAVAYSDTAAGAQARLSVAIHQTEVTIGTALLPTITKLATRLADWLNKSKNQKALQQDVNQAVKIGGSVVNAFAAAVHAVTPVVKAVDKVTGSFKTTLEDLAVVVGAWKFTGFVSGLGLVGKTAKTSAGEVGLLRSRLLVLRALGPIGITIAVGFGIKEGEQKFAKWLGSTAVGKTLGLGDFGTLADMERLFKKQHPGTSVLSGPVGGGGVRGGGGIPVGLGGSAVSARPAQPLSASTLLNLALANDPNNLTLLNQKRAADIAAISFLRRRFAEGKVTNKKYVAEYTALVNDRNSMESQIASIAKVGLGALARARKGIIPYGQLSGTIRGSAATAMGRAIVGSELPGHVRGTGAWGAFAVPMSLQVAAARAGTTAGTGDDMRVAASTRKFAEMAIHAGRLSWQGLIDAYNTITAQNSILASQAKATHHRVVSSTALTAGIVFGSVAARREQEARIAQALAHGGQAIHTHVHLDGREIAHAVTQHQHTSERRNAVQRRGQNAGRHLP